MQASDWQPQGYVDAERERDGQCAFASPSARCSMPTGHDGEHEFTDDFASPEPEGMTMEQLAERQAAEAAAETAEAVEALNDGAEISVEAGSALAEEVDGELVEGPDPELAPAVDEFLGANAALVVADPQDRHEGMVAMDAHDIEKLIASLTELVQVNTMRKWVYRLPGGEEGLTIHAVEDITQRMNWTGKCRLRTLPKTLTVEKEVADAGNGDEVFYVATIFAEDQMTGQVEPGVSTEPQYMKLKPATADKKRQKGASIPKDNRIFDVFARTKAVGKAKRNALGCFIPTEVEQTVLAMATNNPGLVERIQSADEAKLAEMPAPLGTPEAIELEGRCKAIYQEIRELGNGKGKLALPPGRFNAQMTQSRHSIEALETTLGWLEERREAVAKRFAEIEAEESAGESS